MKIYEIGEAYGTNSLTMVHREMPITLPNQVLVEVKAVSLNYRDTLVVNGIWRPPVGRVPVSDGIGYILEVGSEVKHLKRGDRVAGLFFPKWLSGKPTPEKLKGSLGGTSRNGMLQQFITLGEDEVVKIPAYLSDEEGATLPCAGLVAWHALMEHNKIQKGETILIQGTGSVSLFAMQYAKLAGANIIVLSGSDEKLEKIAEQGVQHLLNYKTTPSWEKLVMEITNGRGVDHIVEIVGGNHINRSIEVVAMSGVISIIGLIGGNKGELNTSGIMEKNICLQGVVVGSREMFQDMNQTLEVNQLHPFIDRVFPFEQTLEAFELQEKGDNFGKICISV